MQLGQQKCRSCAVCVTPCPSPVRRTHAWRTDTTWWSLDWSTTANDMYSSWTFRTVGCNINAWSTKPLTNGSVHLLGFLQKKFFANDSNLEWEIVVTSVLNEYIIIGVVSCTRRRVRYSRVCNEYLSLSLSAGAYACISLCVFRVSVPCSIVPPSSDVSALYVQICQQTWLVWRAGYV